MGIYSCNSSPHSNGYPAADDFSLAIPKDSSALYYSLDSFPFVSDIKNKGSDSFMKAMYSEILFHLEEPVLYNYKGNSETVRLLWVRAFENPVVIRLSKVQESVFVNIKELEKEFYNYDSFVYKKKLDTVFMLSSANSLNDFFGKTEVEKSFRLPTNDRLNDGRYKDVTKWVLEYNLKGRYRSILRLYLDSLSLTDYPTVKNICDIGSAILPMKSRGE